MRDGKPPELLIDLLLAYNEEIPHSFLTRSKLVERVKESLVMAEWLDVCV
jgi:hypothetical protein